MSRQRPQPRVIVNIDGGTVTVRNDDGSYEDLELVVRGDGSVRVRKHQDPGIDQESPNTSEALQWMMRNVDQS